MKLREPKYRIDRAAEEAAAWQGLKNLIRRLLGLPVVVTAEQARQKERARWGADTKPQPAAEPARVPPGKPRPHHTKAD